MSQTESNGDVLEIYNVTASKSSSETRKDNNLCDSRLDPRDIDQPQQESEDDDSNSTVLSEQSRSSDEESSVSVGDNSSCCCPKQLEIEFKVRDGLLDEFVKGINPMYAKAIRENEMAARREKIQLVRRRGRRREGASDDELSQALAACSPSKTMPHEIRKRRSWARAFQSIQVTTACDWNNSIPGAAHVILYCVSHGSCYQITEACVDFFIARRFQNQEIVYAVLILLSMALLRITGGMWNYVDYVSYRRIKFDMHNRLRIGRADAYVAKWFRCHDNIRAFSNLLAFYIAFISVSYLQERGIESLDRLIGSLLDSLRALKEQIVEDATCALGGAPVDVKESEIVEIDRYYTWYYVFSAILATILLHMLGFPFGK